jgi:outer membrane immunogenic protein
MGNITTTRVQFNGVVARVGVNYHFNWGAPAPVVAKY